MAWQRRWRILSKAKWLAILRALEEMPLEFRRRPLELIVREEPKDKTARQRALFHAVADDLGQQLGYFPGEMKRTIKQYYYGDGWEKFSTEALDHEHYGDLIECTYMIAAELGIYIPDRRTK